MLPSKERLNPSLSFTKSNECPFSPFHTQPLRPVPTHFLSLKTVPGVKCRPNHGRRIREEDRDEAAGQAGGISLPKRQISVIDAAENGNIPQSKYPSLTDKVLEGLGGGLGGGEGGSPLDASSMFANEFEAEVTTMSPRFGVKFDI